MSDNLTLIQNIIVEKFKADGFTGLYCPEFSCELGCTLDEPFACIDTRHDNIPIQCLPGYKVVCKESDCEDCDLYKNVCEWDIHNDDFRVMKDKPEASCYE